MSDVQSVDVPLISLNIKWLRTHKAIIEVDIAYL